MIKLSIVGCCGRMGLEILKQTQKKDFGDKFEIVACVDSASSKYIGKSLEPLVGFSTPGVSGNLADAFTSSDVVIEFSAPEVTAKCAELASKHKKILVSGTTGINELEMEKISKLADSTLIVHSANMSFGVNILFMLVEKAAKLLDESFDIEILEMHHNKKVDAPSGTALAVGRHAAKGRGVNLKDVAVYERYGNIGARKQGEIGFATLRGGDVVGNHSAIFASNGEVVEITHRASDRSVLANGAVKAAVRAFNLKLKSPEVKGLKNVLDLLEFKS